MLHGQVPVGGAAAAVVNDQLKFPGMAFPARSFTPLLPPITTAVYKVEVASAAAGWNVAVALPALYATVPATCVFPVLDSWNVLVLTVAGSTASLKVTDTAVVVLTLVAPLVGFTELTDGGVVSAPVPVVKTTSTQ